MNSFSATVRTLSHKGHGVVDHPDGRVFFANGLWIGDQAKFRLSGNEKNYDTIHYERLLQSSPARVEVNCPHQGPSQCGGCPWMFVAYEEQIKAKELRLDFLLAKNEIKVAERSPLISAPKTFGYRNRAQFKTDGTRLGYVTEGTNDLFEIDDCIVLNPAMRELFQGLKTKLPQTQWEPTSKHQWSYLEVDDQQSLSQVEVNRRRPFRQGNSEQNQAMKKWIRDTLKDEDKNSPFVEAFCGSGNLTEALSEAGFDNILASEVRGSAIVELREKNLSGVKVLEIDMNEKNVWKKIAGKQAKAEILLVDPPREGLEVRSDIFEYLKKLRKIIYISCEPNTWSRDVKDFQGKGWRVESLTPLDLFPHTPHLELMSVLARS